MLTSNASQTEYDSSAVFISDTGIVGLVDGMERAVHIHAYTDAVSLLLDTSAPGQLQPDASVQLEYHDNVSSLPSWSWRKTKQVAMAGKAHLMSMAAVTLGSTGDGPFADIQVMSNWLDVDNILRNKTSPSKLQPHTLLCVGGEHLPYHKAFLSSSGHHALLHSVQTEWDIDQSDHDPDAYVHLFPLGSPEGQVQGSYMSVMIPGHWIVRTLSFSDEHGILAVGRDVCQGGREENGLSIELFYF